MTAHWLIARHIKQMTAWALIPYQATAAFWDAWHRVYRG